MENLKVTIELATPMVVPKDHLHLDALLGALHEAKMKRDKGEDFNPSLYEQNLPIERFGDGEDWVYKASILKLSVTSMERWMQTGGVNLTQAAEHRELGWLNIKANQPIIGGGPFKASLNYHDVANGELIAYCVGDKAEIEALLAHCEQVGANRVAGWGRVSSITVESIDEIECNWKNRAMPLSATGLELTHARAIACIRGPYWDKSQLREARIPLE